MPIMWGNPNKAITTIIGRMNHEKPEEVEGNKSNDYEMGLEACAEEMLKAFETKNVKALVQAMKDFHAMYDEENEMPEESEEMENGGY